MIAYNSFDISLLIVKFRARVVYLTMFNERYGYDYFEIRFYMRGSKKRRRILENAYYIKKIITCCSILGKLFFS